MKLMLPWRSSATRQASSAAGTAAGSTPLPGMFSRPAKYSGVASPGAAPMPAITSTPFVFAS
ncbi:MAG: hypothetical protein U0835_21610 [Isosphaeraceae bacterium]